MLAAALPILRQRLPDAQAVYVFGSAARGETHPQSDLDLAVLLERPLALMDRFEIQEAVASGVGRDVDLVDLRAASTVMQVQVIGTGRVVLDAAPEAWQWFEMVALSQYALLNEERAGILADIAERGTVYG